MWALRVLTGSNAGQIFNLKDGQNLVGRAPQCNIRLLDLDVSKEHALIILENNRLSLIDNHSRNGTYLNGVLVSRGNLKKGDKISINQTICDIVFIPPVLDRKVNDPNKTVTIAQTNHGLMNSPSPQGQGVNPYRAQGLVNYGTPYGYAGDNSPHNQADLMAPAEPVSEEGFFKRYFEEVMMPGVYQLGQIMEFRLVIGLFMLVFAVLVTALSTIPMLAITSDSIQIESRRRALTIARNLAHLNQQALLKEMESALSTQTADVEEGVSQALIVRQSDGSVLAPATKAGTVPNIPFIETARREQKELVEQIDSSHIAVAVPLSAFNPETATYAVKAFAVVVYDMGALAVDDGRTLSLFFQTLLIALALGFVLYYLFYRFVEYPIVELNRQIDNGLKNPAGSTADIPLEFPALQNLVSNINNLLARLANPDTGSSGMSVNKDLEVINLVRLVGYAALAISADQVILGVNHAAESLLNTTESQLRNQPIALIPDQALQKSLFDLMEHASRDPAIPSKNELEFAGENTEINCQAITDKGRVSYYLVTIIPLGGS